MKVTYCKSHGIYDPIWVGDEKQKYGAMTDMCPHHNEAYHIHVSFDKPDPHSMIGPGKYICLECLEEVRVKLVRDCFDLDGWFVNFLYFVSAIRKES